MWTSSKGLGFRFCRTAEPQALSVLVDFRLRASRPLCGACPPSPSSIVKIRGSKGFIIFLYKYRSSCLGFVFPIF